MKKLLVLSIIFLISLTQVAFAEKLPVRITNSQIISTDHDEIEVGDLINFVTVNDIYIDNQLYIIKGTPITGLVDFFHPNGWAGDSAEIRFKTFETTDVKGQKVVINYPLIISGNDIKNNDIKQYFAMVFISLIRGSEVSFEPDNKMFNIFIER